MTTVYFEVPRNWNAIEAKVTTVPEKIADALLYNYDKVYFYDTCSFRGHSNLIDTDIDYIISHIKQENGVVVITRCILMELASKSGELNQKYIDLINRMIDVHGVEVIVMNEEDLFNVLSECFSTAKEINSYLMWSVRMLGIPTSTIERTLNENPSIKKKVKEGKGITEKNVFPEFFKTVRGNKTEADNLGEELLAICLHILSHITGEPDYKFNIITEDKGARAAISNLLLKAKEQYAGRKVVIYSTPKLTKEMIELGRLRDSEVIARILGMGRVTTITVFGSLPHEFDTTEHSMDTRELADIMLVPNGIDIRF